MGLRDKWHFLGEIKEDRLKGILVFPSVLVFQAVKKILGDKYIKNEDLTRASSDIATMFLVVAMHFEKDREVVMKLC